MPRKPVAIYGRVILWPSTRLCYVSHGTAYFTTAALKDQWGDDWNDRPYEHNAGEPYAWAPHRNVPEYKVYELRFVGPFDQPSEGHLNSPYSVEDINGKVVPWLRPSQWLGDDERHGISIFAGTSMTEFFRLVLEAGGVVYAPIPNPDEDHITQEPA